MYELSRRALIRATSLDAAQNYGIRGFCLEPFLTLGSEGELRIHQAIWLSFQLIFLPLP